MSDLLTRAKTAVGSGWLDAEKEFKVLEQMTGIDYKLFVALAMHESGLNPKIENNIGAVGIFQWLPSTYQGLGLTEEIIKAMTVAQQVKLQQFYIKPLVGHVRDWYDIFMFNFFPVAVLQNWSDDAIFEYKNLSAATVSAQNFPLDLNKNGEITVKEYKQYMDNYISKDSGLSEVISTIQNVPTDYSSSEKKKMILKIVLFGLLLVLVIFVLIHRFFKKKSKTTGYSGNRYYSSKKRSY